MTKQTTIVVTGTLRVKDNLYVSGSINLHIAAITKHSDKKCTDNGKCPKISNT